MENEVKEPAPKYNYISPDEYLEMERASEEKHEYYQGRVYPLGAPLEDPDLLKEHSEMPWEHVVVTKNINTVILPFLKGKQYNMFGTGLRIYIPRDSSFAYPDFSILCNSAEISGIGKNDPIQPSVIIEVLSELTKNYDRGTKFYLYRSIETLKEYIFIDSTSVYAGSFKWLEDNSWLLVEYKTPSASFDISTINLTLYMKDIYDGISFEE